MAVNPAALTLRSRIIGTLIRDARMAMEKDVQDFLAMAALQFVTRLISLEERENHAEWYDEMSALNRELEEIIRKE